MDEILYSLDGYNPKYGICTHRCKNGVWEELKNCCCGHDGDNDWYVCGDKSQFPCCDEANDGLIIYTNCYPKNL